MATRCDICLDKDCEGKTTCNCDTCANRAKCPKVLRATVRITTQCTQSCAHCCFECSPSQKRMMSMETAEAIARFFRTNQVPAAQIMGGEFFCNPQWEQIVSILAEALERVSIVSNSDWAPSEEIRAGILRLHERFPRLYFRLSDDRWHTNRHVDTAAAFLDEHGIACRREQEEDAEAIVPVGRGSFHASLYGMFACYCHNPEKKYTFLIDEEGSIAKCFFGTWIYANAKDYADGGFRARFKEFNLKFYGCFIGSCAACRHAWECRSKQ